ncbi:MAG: TetR/AcrR family transcriptional regulator [Eggerthellaceae bacterium]|nr:TetR/AcrR family transcriptional regulator [Eggerthellaceae bacterium]
MSPKVVATRDSIAQAAFEIVREEGHEALTVRHIAERLSCSTQPLLYHFKSIKEIRRAAYEIADAFHTGYITDLQGSYPDPMLELGMRYLRFGHDEPHLFRFLFQTNEYAGRDLLSLNDDENLAPVIDVLQQAAGLDRSEAKLVFTTLAVMAHGYASLMANNAMPFNEELANQLLVNAFVGAVTPSDALLDQSGNQEG